MSSQQSVSPEVLEEVLRGVLLSVCLIDPSAMPKVVRGLRAAAAVPGQSSQSTSLLSDLASFMEVATQSRSKAG